MKQYHLMARFIKEQISIVHVGNCTNLRALRKYNFFFFGFWGKYMDCQIVNTMEDFDL